MKDVLKNLLKKLTGSKVERSERRTLRLRIEELEERVNPTVGWGCGPSF